jgi:hypothetical protein
MEIFWRLHWIIVKEYRVYHVRIDKKPFNLVAQILFLLKYKDMNKGSINGHSVLEGWVFDQQPSEYPQWSVILCLLCFSNKACLWARSEAQVQPSLHKTLISNPNTTKKLIIKKLSFHVNYASSFKTHPRWAPQPSYLVTRDPSLK